MTNVLIVHDCPIYRQGLRTIVEQTGDLQVIGEAVEVEPLLTLARSQQPEVVLLDGTLTSCLPRYSAADMTSALRRIGAQGIVVLVPSADEEAMFSFLMHGAAAYELSSLSAHDLVQKIHRVARGEYLMESTLFCSAPPATQTPEPPHVCQQAESVRPAKSAEEQESNDLWQLTEQEFEVLRLTARGLSNERIGKALEVTSQTAKNHMSSILAKFNLSNRTAAVIFALRHHLLSLDELDLSEMAPKRKRHDVPTPLGLERIAS